MSDGAGDAHSRWSDTGGDRAPTAAPGAAPGAESPVDSAPGPAPSAPPLGQISPETLLNMVADAGVGIYATSLAGEFTYANRYLAQLLGFETVAQLMASGKRAQDFYVDPADRAEVGRRNDHGETVQGRIVRGCRLDGGTIWLSEHANPIHNSAGELVGYFGSVSDVTELVETQRRLGEAEADYRRIFERATEGIYRSSLEGRQLRANPALCALNGYDSEAEQLAGITDIGREWYVDPTRRDTFQALLARDGVVREFESEIRCHLTRERIWISENAYVVRDADGAPLFYEGTVRNITARKRAEEKAAAALRRAESANRAKSEFLAHMSHELRTPLNAILGFADLLRTMGGSMSPDKLRGYVEDIHASGSYLLDLINDILDLARIENDAFPLDPAPMPAAEAIDAARAAVQPIADQQSIRLNVKANGLGDVAVLADRRALHQCLLNLLSNALKFSPHGGEVELVTTGDRAGEASVEGTAGGRAEAGVPALRFTVRDRGPGFPDGLLANLGEPFLAQPGMATARPAGTGLGLAITKALAERMGGRLTAGNRTHGGARVALIVPLATAAADGDGGGGAFAP